MISILVAVYNAERFLDKCLDSLCRQTYADFEVFCIDDASTDRSPAILADYTARDARFHLLSMAENGGQAKARNYGLRHCQGDIITFVDADDWLADDSLQIIADTFAQHESADCVLFRCIMTYEDGRQEDYRGKRFDSMTGHDAFFCSLSWAIHGVYAARAELFARYPYDDSCRIYSDDNTTRTHYYLSREVRQSAARYYYLQHPLSATHRLSTDHMLYMVAADSMRRQLRALGCDEDILSIYEGERWKIVVDCYFYYYQHRRSMTLEEKSYCLEAIKKGWRSIDGRLLRGDITRKFGYAPIRFCWLLFRAEEEVYFFLRQLLRR